MTKTNRELIFTTTWYNFRYLFEESEQEDWQRGIDHVKVGEAHAVVQRLCGVFVEEGEVDLRREGRDVLVEEVLDQQGHAHVEPESKVTCI